MTELLQWASFVLNCVLVPIWFKLVDLKTAVGDLKERVKRIEGNCDTRQRNCDARYLPHKAR
jgi:hypothetical protein